MEFTGKIKSLGKDLATGKWNLQVELNENAQEVMGLIKHEKLDIRLKQHRDKRSLDANAYYWYCLPKLLKFMAGRITRLTTICCVVMVR